MPLQFAHGALEWTTGAAGTTFTVSGLSFQPKALMFVIFGLNSGVDATSDTVDWDLGGGFAVSTSSRASHASYDDDANAAEATGRGYRTDCVLHLINNAATDQGRLDLDVINSDGFRLIVDVQAVRAQRVMWRAWGGTELASAEIIEIAEPASTGSVDYTGTFQGNVALFIGSNISGAAPSAVAENFGIAFGAATGAAEQWTFSTSADFGNTTGDGGRYGLSGECLSQWAQSAGPTLDARAAFERWNSNGFRLNWLQRAVTGRKTSALVMKGGRWRAGTYTHNVTGTNNQQAVTCGMRPQGGLLATHGAASGGTTFAAFGFGSFVSTSDRLGAGILGEAATANIEVDQSIEFDQVVSFPATTGSPPAVLKSVDLISLNGDGFTMNADVGGGATTDLFGFLVWRSKRVMDMVGVGGSPSAR